MISYLINRDKINLVVNLSPKVHMRTLIIYLVFQNLTMLGERALDLVREAKRSQDVLGPYNEDKVNKT